MQRLNLGSDKKSIWWDDKPIHQQHAQTTRYELY